MNPPPSTPHAGTAETGTAHAGTAVPDTPHASADETGTPQVGGAETASRGARSTAGSRVSDGEGGRGYAALWWAKVQSAGPVQVSPETPAVAGLTRAAEPDGKTIWMLPSLPDGSGHAVLEELGTPPVAVEQPNETARVLAICVTCCWPDRSGPAWPGVTGTLAQIKAVYAGLRGRGEQSSDLTLIIGSLRRLHATSWLSWNEKAGEVRLGPRVITWGPTQLAGLRELCRILPDPPPAVHTEHPPAQPPPTPLPTTPATDTPPHQETPADTSTHEETPGEDLPAHKETSGVDAPTYAGTRDDASTREGTTSADDPTYGVGRVTPSGGGSQYGGGE